MPKLWEMVPIQTAAKSFAFGTLCVGSFWAYNTFVSYGQSKIGLAFLEDPQVGHTLKSAVRSMIEHDPDLVQLLERLLLFRRFYPDEFDSIVTSSFIATETRHLEYQQESFKASSSFRIREQYQRIIEDIRIFRALLEKSMPSAMEDFDEIAVDLNAKIEQICTDAIQDTYLK